MAETDPTTDSRYFHPAYYEGVEDGIRQTKSAERQTLAESIALAAVHGCAGELKGRPGPVADLVAQFSQHLAAKLRPDKEPTS